jgi:hypothetical protein
MVSVRYAPTLFHPLSHMRACEDRGFPGLVRGGLLRLSFACCRLSLLGVCLPSCDGCMLCSAQVPLTFVADCLARPPTFRRRRSRLTSFVLEGETFWGVCVRWPAGLVPRSEPCPAVVSVRVCQCVFVLTLPLLPSYRMSDHCAFRSLASLDIVIGTGRTGFSESIFARD